MVFVHHGIKNRLLLPVVHLNQMLLKVLCPIADLQDRQVLRVKTHDEFHITDCIEFQKTGEEKQ